MHIPDGYLSPSTCAAAYAAAVPLWALAGRRVTRVVKSRYVPLVAVAAAYAFLVMMFNVPIPDGTTAHATGAVLVAVLLGPWAAVIAVSIALLIQAMFFGDGGVLAYGANALNIAILMPFVGYAVYRLVARGSGLTARRRAIAAGIGAYVGINAAALATAIEFGIQPRLFHAADGTPLYAPFSLSHTIPAMLFAHLLVAGVVEAVLTAGVVRYLQRANVPILRINHPGIADQHDSTSREVRVRWAIVGLVSMVVLTPLGLLASGTAFGEDAPDELDTAKYGLDRVPAGLARDAGWWKRALLDGYGFGDGAHSTLGYVLSAVIGVLTVAALVVLPLAIVRVVRGPHRRVAEVPA